MNIHELRPPLSMAPRDPRLDRVKVYLFPFSAVMTLLASTGALVPKVEGWTQPEDEAVILGVVMANIGGQICVAITVHSPRFPVVLTQPPVVPLAGSWRPLPEGVSWDDLPHEADNAAPA